MKKTLSLILVLVISLSLVLSLSACAEDTPSESYEFSHATITNNVPNEYRYLYDSVHELYSDTTLKFYEDGSFKIDTPLFLSFNMTIDEGTYSVNSDGKYFFRGFEYETSTYGYKTDAGFEIHFATSGLLLVTLYYA